MPDFDDEDALAARIVCGERCAAPRVARPDDDAVVIPRRGRSFFGGHFGWDGKRKGEVGRYAVAWVGPTESVNKCSIRDLSR